MPAQATGDAQFNPYLSSTQQDLLLAALASNNFNNNNNNNNNSDHQSNAIKRSDSDPAGDKQFVPPSYIDGAFLDTTQKNIQQPTDFTNFDFDDTSPYLDYLDGDTSLNFDSNDLGGEDMFGSVPGPRTESSGSDKGDKADKRKSPDDYDDDEEGDPKRREGDDKMAKKPGRKPLTSEPTTKRKAQNRAAQRAFRERKEKHLKDLETKVDSLTKAQEADKHENGVLRAQVERLQTELREYRKRMSMNNTGISQSPPSTSKLNARSNSKPGSDFQFDFPSFGSLPGSQLPRRDNATSAIASLSRQNSSNRYPSPKSQPQSQPQSQGQSQSSSAGQTPASNHNSRSGSMNTGNNIPPVDGGFNSTLPQMSSSLFTPSILNANGADYGFTKSPTAVQNVDNGGDSNSGISRAFRFNSGSTSSNTASPSVSSQSHYNANSSCGTSPEPVNDSPAADIGKPNVNTNLNAYSFNANPTNQNSFANITNTSTNNNNNNNDFNIDWLASQNGGQFDPVLFGDYRDSQDAIVGDGDFNNGFFNDAFPYDFGSPLNFNLNSPKQQQQQPQVQQTSSASRNLLAEVEKAREGNDDDYVLRNMAQQISHEKKVPLAQAEKMLNCNTIWSQLQSNPDFKDGKFDLDGLCAELRAKAKCSESGVTVPSEHVDAAFKKLSGNPGAEKATNMSENHYAHERGVEYIFQRNSVDEALRRLGNGH